MIPDHLPDCGGNPLLDCYRQSTASGRHEQDRDALVRRYGFAVPTDEALESITAVSPEGVVELGAGTGYWARLLRERGVDVVAYDLFPPPSPESRWFAGVMPWYPVAHGGEAMVGRHPERTLLLIWPSRNEEWAARAAVTYHLAGGRTLAFVGEGPGGRTGDDQLHALLGHYDRCLACAYQLADTACICGMEPQWRLHCRIELPHWQGYSDDLRCYARVDTPAARPLARVPARRRIRSRRPSR